MATNVTRLCFTTQHQTCKTKTKSDFLVSDRSYPKTDGLRPHHYGLDPRLILPLGEIAVTLALASRAASASAAIARCS